MWAYSKEAFCVHLTWAMGPRGDEATAICFGQRKHIPIEDLTAPVTEEWAEEVVNKAFEIVGYEY